MRILIVDDHPMFSDGLSFLLQEHYQTLEMQQANDSRDCISILDNGYTPDLILLDLHLPGLSGIALLQQLKQLDYAFPALVVSASQSLHDVAAALEQGARGFITKSSQSSELLNAIRSVLKGKLYLPKTPTQT